MANEVLEWNLSLAQVKVGSIPVTGWGASDALNLTPDSDDWERTISIGGIVTYARISNKVVTGSITVTDGSKTYNLLAEKRQDQLAEAAVGKTTPIPFQYYDPISGNRVTETHLRFMRGPDMTITQAPTDRVFNIELPNAEIEYGRNVVANV